MQKVMIIFSSFDFGIVRYQLLLDYKVTENMLDVNHGMFPEFVDMLHTCKQRQTCLIRMLCFLNLLNMSKWIYVVSMFIVTTQSLLRLQLVSTQSVLCLLQKVSSQERKIMTFRMGNRLKKSFFLVVFCQICYFCIKMI